MLSETEGMTLLKMARKAIEAYVCELTPEKCDDAHSPALNEDAGAFVTIHKDGELRGCIGTFASPNTLHKTVTDMAVSAATRDPRFAPLSPSELEEITLEISVLSPLKEIRDVSEIEIGRHGLYIIEGPNRGVLLPQVAVEHGMDREEFLANTCIKAGLPATAWMNGATIFTFEAEIFKEEEEPEGL
ncbi:MAG: AmmeMemoRadiSam system protein A [Thermodesulfobacteriota bacterium]